MSEPDKLPVKIVKRIAGRCLYSGCSECALEDSDFCAPHEAHERGRDAGKKRRRRQKLAKSGLCVAGCGRKVPRRRKPGGGIQQRECAGCRKKHNKRMQRVRAKACVPGSDRDVPGAPSEPNRWRPDFDPETGAAWQRYRGKMRRGRLTREEQLDERIRDVRHAREELVKLERALAALKRPEVMALPPIQREAAYREAGQYAGTAGRYLDGLVEELG